MPQGLRSCRPPTHHRATETRGHHACSRAATSRVWPSNRGSEASILGDPASGPYIVWRGSPEQTCSCGASLSSTVMGLDSQSDWAKTIFCGYPTLTLSSPPSLVIRKGSVRRGYLRPVVLTSMYHCFVPMLLPCRVLQQHLLLPCTPYSVLRQTLGRVPLHFVRRESARYLSPTSWGGRWGRAGVPATSTSDCRH